MEILVNVSTEVFVPCVGGAFWHPLNAFGQFGGIHYSIWRNTVCTLDKYIQQIEQIYCGFCINRFFHPLWMLFVGIPNNTFGQFGEM